MKKDITGGGFRESLSGYGSVLLEKRYHRSDGVLFFSLQTKTLVFL